MKVIGEFRKQSTTGILFLKCSETTDSDSLDDGNVKPRIFLNSSLDPEVSAKFPLDEGKRRVQNVEPLLADGIELNIPEDRTTEISDASLELLNTDCVAGRYFGLLTLVYRYRRCVAEAGEDSYSGSIVLLQSSTSSLTRSVILETLKVVEPQPCPLHLHLLPSQTTDSQSRLDEAAIFSSDPDDEEFLMFKNQLIVLSLGLDITVCQIQTTPLSTTEGPKIKIINSVRIYKSFWWAEWNPQHQFLAFAHNQKRQSIFVEDIEGSSEESNVAQTQSILSVFQYHNNQSQRESVLNFPLDSLVLEDDNNFWSSMISNPMVLCSDNLVARSLRLLTHTRGSVNLFYLRKPDDSNLLSYTVILLHHNQTLNVDLPMDAFEGSMVNNDIPSVDVDVCLCKNGQYLVVLAWPHFLHILDIGVSHDPGHHFVFNLPILFPGLTATIDSSSRFRLFWPGLAETTDDSALHFFFKDLTVQTLELTPSFFLSALRKSSLKYGSDVNLTLATIHSLLLHLNSPHAAKRLIGEIVRRVQNLHLTKIFQEFIVASAHSAIVKDLLPDMEAFLHFIPYCPIPLQRAGDENMRFYNGKTYLIKLESNSAKVSNTLLSPSQRIFSHHITDTWTSLWESNALLTSSRRFCHKTIADKLLLTLQCYKPEALSRASTPMSPSSPMVCGSLGDIVSMFGRRSQELQLPFVEHESCTANKQEYIFSINLRELSMHLLKERKDWPLACHTVAGKYVNALTDASRLLCHLISLTTITQLGRPLRPKDKGFPLIDSLTAERQLNLFILMEHYALAHGTIACPLPSGFTPFFAYLGYRVLRFEQFLWHVRCGTFDLQIDMVKTIMAGLSDIDEKDVEKKLQLISFLPKSRASRVLNGWSHPIAIGLRARQHASDLLSGSVSTQSRKYHFSTQVNRVKSKADVRSSENPQGPSPLDTFFRLLTGKANAADIDLGLLTEATMLSMK